MKLGSATAIVALVLISAGDSAAQTFFSLPQNAGQFRTATVLYDNFFQAPAGRPSRDVLAALVQVRLEETVGSSERVWAYVDWRRKRANRARLVCVSSARTGPLRREHWRW